MRWKTLQAARRVYGPNSQELNTVRDELRAAEDAVMRGDAEQGYESLLELANAFHYDGLPRLVEATVADLRSLSDRGRPTRRQEGWILNYEQMAAAELGDIDRATRGLEEMLAIGRKLDDEQLISTALQNLSIRSHIAGELRRAFEQAREAMKYKLKLGDYFAAAQIISNIASLLLDTDDETEAEDLLRRFESIFIELRDSGLLASFHGILGQVQVRRGDFEEANASFKEARRYAALAGDLQKEVIALQNLGSLELDRNQPGKAIRWLRKAIRLAEPADAPPRLEGLYRLLGLALHLSGRNREAVASLEAARQQAKRFADARLWAGATADLGAITSQLGDPKAGGILLSRALDVYRELGDRDGVVAALRNLAATRERQGKFQDAHSALEEAIELSGDQTEELAELLRQLAELALSHDDVQGAIEAFDREQAVVAVLGSRVRAWSAVTAAATLRQSRASHESIRFYDRAVDLYARLRDAHLGFQARNDRALALADVGQTSRALRDLKTCLRAAVRLDDRALQLQARLNIGEIHRRLGRPEEAVESLNVALDLSESLGDRESEAHVLELKGLALIDQGQLDEATSTFRRARDYARRTRSASTVANATGGLAHVEFLRGHFRRAARGYERAVHLHPSATHQLLEDAAGWLISLSAAGTDDGLEVSGQKVVDLGQSLSAEAYASESFTTAASHWLDHGQSDQAAQFYAVAILLAAMSGWRFGAPVDLASKAEDIFLPIMVMFEHLSAHDQDLEPFANDVWAILDRDYESMGTHLRFALDVALETYSAPDR